MTRARISTHEVISTELAGTPDAELTALVLSVPAASVGVGGDSRVIEVAGSRVFVKRVPLTDRELDEPHSTADLFGLPLWCQYGIGGPSLSAWRELAANLAVTDGVLTGRTQAFPILHHWRVLPGRVPPAGHEDVQAALARLGDSTPVRARLDALAAARHSLVLVSEYLPFSAAHWLAEHASASPVELEHQLGRMVAFLREGRLLHMDAHFENMRSDGHRLHLTDFGLATSPDFALADSEREFVRRHADHDADYASMRLVNWIVAGICRARGLAADDFAARNALVEACAAGDLPSEASPEARTVLARHSAAAARMNALYWRLFDGDLDARYEPAHDGNGAGIARFE